MNITFAKPSRPATGALVVGVGEGGALSPGAASLDRAVKGAVKRAIAADPFEGKARQFLSIVAPAGIKAGRIVLAGLGKGKEFDASSAEKLGGALTAYLGSLSEASAAVQVDAVKGSKLSVAEMAARIAYGATLRSYRFDKYRTKIKDAEKKKRLKKLVVMTAEPAKARAANRPLAAVADGVFLTRDLVSEPANVIYPVTLAARARALTKDGVKVQVLNETRKGLADADGGGLRQESRLRDRRLEKRWRGARRGQRDCGQVPRALRQQGAMGAWCPRATPRSACVCWTAWSPTITGPNSRADKAGEAGCETIRFRALPVFLAHHQVNVIASLFDAEADLGAAGRSKPVRDQQHADAARGDIVEHGELAVALAGHQSRCDRL